MNPPDEIKLAQELIQCFHRAKKNLRMYPVNNPIYSKTIEEAYRKAEEFLEHHGDLVIKVKQNEMYLDESLIYQSAEKEDNFAFFFFKDGMRELSFKGGLELDELREFLQAISYDFDRRDDDEDVVTLLWEKDFEHIKYVVDENFLLEDDVYETEAVTHVTEETTEESELKKAYQEAFVEDEPKAMEIVPVSHADMGMVVSEIERDSADKVPRLVEILFGLFAYSPASEYGEIAGLINEALEFSVKNCNLRSAVFTLARVRDFLDEGASSDVLKKELMQVYAFAASPGMVSTLGEHMDAGLLTEDEEAFTEYVQYLDKEAISSFIALLGELKRMEARKTVLNALAFLGGKDIFALAKGLSDPRWYVVRNIIYIFRKIGDRRVVEFLVRAANHSDVRVRMEVLKAIGELGGQGATQTLKDALSDPEPSVRSAAVRALGRIKSEPSKKIIMDRILDKSFPDVEFNEKKEYFEALAGWNDAQVVEFLMRILKTSSLLRRAKLDELKACAAYSLGIIGHKECLAHLHKMRESKNRLLSEYAYSAIRRIEYGQQ